MVDTPDQPDAGKKSPRPPRPHPFADEVSPEAETRHDPRKVTATWLGGSIAILILGLTLNHLFSPHTKGTSLYLDQSLYDGINVAMLFIGLTMLGLRAWMTDKAWTKWLGIPGWLIFGFYWGLTARDLFIAEDADYVNSFGAGIALFASTYFAYHEWLDNVRTSPSPALEFLRKTAVIASGAYFAISYITPLRIGLIKMVGQQTNWFLGLFGLNTNLHFELREAYTDRTGPVSFWYTDTLGTCPDGTISRPVGEAPCLGAYDGAGNWLQDLLFYIPKAEEMAGEHGLKIVMVSIILACTAIQSIMFFVGMFVGTPGADWRKKLRFSVGVGIIIYILNLLRNAGIIWAYGQGHMSFWFVHNFLAKIVTLSVLIGIAYMTFRGYPEFFRALGNVLDMGQRDGPIERTLKLGKRRPTDEPAQTASG